MISYKDNERYMAVLYQGKSKKWICRLYFNGNKKYFTVPDANKNIIRYDINNVYDIEKYIDILSDVLHTYL